MWVSGTVFAAYAAWILTREVSGDRAWIIAEYIALPGTTAAFLLAWRRHPQAGAVVLILTVAFQEHFGVLLTRGVALNVGTPVLPVLVVAAGMLLGGTAAYIVAGVMVFSLPVAIMLGERAFGPAPTLTGLSEFYALLALDLTNLAAAVLVAVGTGVFRKTLQAARAAEDTYSTLVRHAPLGIVQLDADGRVMLLNPVAESLIGAQTATARGRFLTELLGTATDTDPVTIPLPDPDTGTETLVTLRDGDARTVVEMSASRTSQDDGNAGMLVILRDATGRREMEQHAIQLGRMLDQSPGEAYVFDAETLRVRYMSLGARRALGYDPADTDALTITDIAPALTRPEVRRLMTELTERPNEFLPLHGVHRRRDGMAYPVEARLHLVSFAGAPALGLFALDVPASGARAASGDAG